VRSRVPLHGHGKIPSIATDTYINHSDDDNHISCHGKDKGKFLPRTGHEGLEGEHRYSSTLSLTSALDGIGCQYHAPAALTLGKTRYPLYRTLGGPHGRSGWVRKILPPTGIRSPQVRRGFH